MIIPSLFRALLEENSVNIAELGTFFVEKLPAQIKEDVVYPPQNRILFEHAKDVEGFDFVNKLSQWNQIRMDVAQILISEWVNLIEDGVEHNKSVFLDNFGTFSKEVSGKITFQSIIIPELNVENEGFEPIFLTPIIKEENFINVDNVVKDKRIKLIQGEKKRDRIWFVGIISAAVILLCVLLLKDRFSDIYQTFFVKKEILKPVEIDKPEDSAFISSALDEDSATTVVPVVEEENISVPKVEEQHENMPESLPSNNIYMPFEKGKYYVIAGSFLKESDALRHIKEKKLEKYHAKLIIEPHNSRLRVCIGVFDNEIDAGRFAGQTDKSYWILK